MSSIHHFVLPVLALRGIQGPVRRPHGNFVYVLTYCALGCVLSHAEVTSKLTFLASLVASFIAVVLYARRSTHRMGVKRSQFEIGDLLTQLFNLHIGKFDLLVFLPDASLEQIDLVPDRLQLF